MSDMHLYVASLSDYNNGHLLGVWIDLDDATERDEIDEAIAEMLRGSKYPVAEEWAVHD